MEPPTANGRHGPPQPPNMPQHTRAGAQWPLGTWAGNPWPVWAARVPVRAREAPPPLATVGLGVCVHSAVVGRSDFWFWAAVKSAALCRPPRARRPQRRGKQKGHKAFCKIICGDGCACCCSAKSSATPPSTTTHGAAITVHICTRQLFETFCRAVPSPRDSHHAPF